MKCVVFKCEKEATHVHYIRRNEVLHICKKHREMKPFNLQDDKSKVVK